MVYSNKFVVAVKHNGKVLRDGGGVVRLPFGADYSLLLKNKNSVRALVDVEIDGQDVLDGHSLIIGPNEATTLEGFMKGMNVRNKFRFIKKTRQISKYRGDRPDDGLVRVEFKFERPAEVQPFVVPRYKEYGDVSPTLGGSYHSGYTSYSASYTYTSNNTEITSENRAINDGITVPGIETSQSFVLGNIGLLEHASHVIILQLKGRTSKGKKVKKVVTTKTKLTCPTCGKKSRSSAKFCSRCGTYIKK